MRKRGETDSSKGPQAEILDLLLHDVSCVSIRIAVNLPNDYSYWLIGDWVTLLPVNTELRFIIVSRGDLY